MYCAKNNTYNLSRKFIAFLFAYFLVPEYDVTLPFEADEKGRFLTYSLNRRSKRSLIEDDDDNTTTYHYMMDVSGEQLHLQVKRNTNFMAPDLQLEMHDEDGRRIKKPLSRKSFVTGKVASDSDSVVTLSVTDGLVRSSLNPLT